MPTERDMQTTAKRDAGSKPPKQEPLPKETVPAPPERPQPPYPADRPPRVE